MSKTTISRGNVLANTICQLTLPSTTFSTTTTEVTISCPGVKATDMIAVSVDAAMVVGVGVVNAYTNTADQIIVRLCNLTGAQVIQTAATLLVNVRSPEDSPLPANVV
jgi:RNA-binding protein YhbY